jgi:hypothetical protein
LPWAILWRGTRAVQWRGLQNLRSGVRIPSVPQSALLFQKDEPPVFFLVLSGVSTFEKEAHYLKGIKRLPALIFSEAPEIISYLFPF